MFRQRSVQTRELSLEELEHVGDLRAVIAAALAATPVDEESLSRGVWTYVRAERDLGTSPESVMVVLTELVDASTIGAPSVRESMMRQMIRWCVQAHFGYLEGELTGVSANAPWADSVAAPPMIVSNR